MSSASTPQNYSAPKIIQNRMMKRALNAKRGSFDTSARLPQNQKAMSSATEITIQTPLLSESALVIDYKKDAKMYKGNHSQYRKDDILSPDPKITDYMEQRVKQINQMVLHDYKSGHE